MVNGNKLAKTDHYNDVCRCNKQSPSSPPLLPSREASDARQEKEQLSQLLDETAPLPCARADQLGGHEETPEVRALSHLASIYR